MTKTELKKKTNQLIKHAVAGMRKNIDRAILSGSMDIKGAPNDYILPKALLMALLQEEINQVDGRGTCFHKKQKKQAKAIYTMLKTLYSPF